MMDTSPADDNGRPPDYADANDPEEDWEPVTTRYPWDMPGWFE